MTSSNRSESFEHVAALTFDVVGTVVDWHGSIAREAAAFGAAHGFSLDWTRFASEWSRAYASGVACVRKGRLPWTPVDVITRTAVEKILDAHRVVGLSATDLDDLNTIWRRLAPWPDSVPGLVRLRTKYRIATLSNANRTLLQALSDFGGLPWTDLLSADMIERYKPDPEVYGLAPRELGLDPGRIVMVASHAYDVEAAQAAGLLGAFIRRPAEYGPGTASDEPPISATFVADGIEDLAAQLGV